MKAYPLVLFALVCGASLFSSSCEQEKPKPLLDEKAKQGANIKKETKLTAEQENERLRRYFFHLANKAAEGDVESQRELGTRYILGQGLVKNAEKGIPWLTKAAEGGSHPAQYSLAQILYEGELVEANLTSALLWMTKAADSGLLEAQRDLGAWYLEGRRIEMDIDKALVYLEKASQQGDADSLCILGEIYLELSQSTQNEAQATEYEKKAVESIRQAASLQHPRAMQRMKFLQKEQ